MAATSNCDHSGTGRKMPSLPSDIIIEEILPRLPPKSLMRFKCTSVAYNTLISSPEFIDLHLQKSISYDTNRVLIITGKSNSNLYSIDVDSQDPATTIVKIPLPYTLDEWFYGRTISIVSSFNGLLCVTLFQQMWNFDDVPVLINPSTGVYREIPHLRTPIIEGEFWVSFGFGFDDINNDYKLVRVYQNLSEYNYYTEEDHLVFRSNGGFFDEENRDKVVQVADLEVLNGCLCVSAITNLSTVVWIMKEYGVKDSWVKLFELPCSSSPCFRYYGPLGFRKGSNHEILVQKEGRSGLFWCDIESETYGRTEEINGLPDFKDACFSKGSLVPIPGGEKILTLSDEDEMNLWSFVY